MNSIKRVRSYEDISPEAFKEAQRWSIELLCHKSRHFIINYRFHLMNCSWVHTRLALWFWLRNFFPLHPSRRYQNINTHRVYMKLIDTLASYDFHMHVNITDVTFDFARWSWGWCGRRRIPYQRKFKIENHLKIRITHRLINPFAFRAFQLK